MINKCDGAGASILTKSTPWDSSWPKFVGDPRRKRLLGYFEDRFGIGLGTFENFAFLERPQGYWLLTLSSHVRLFAKLQIHSAGIPILRKKGKQLKPTTTAIQTFGTMASKNLVNLNDQQILSLLGQQSLSPSLDTTPGYVILAYRSHILGCGLYTKGRVISQIPRAYLPPQ
jgi:NOL1/NOP2/fmu family ribosome biogenesis protein